MEMNVVSVPEIQFESVAEREQPHKFVQYFNSKI